MKRQKGITLIALVITIIVLLILAGVSMSMMVGQNGILSNAQNSVIADAKAKEEEVVKTSALAAISASSSKGNIALENGYFNQELKNEFGEGNYLLEETTDIFTVTIIETGNSYEVDKFGSVSIKNPFGDDEENDFEIPQNLIAGLYETDSNYTRLIKDWNTLIQEGIITEDGKIVSGKEDILAGDLAISDSIVNIANDSYKGCNALTGVILPSSVTTIGESAFSDCNSLIRAILNDGLMIIGKSAFSCCSYLTEINIPVGVTTIGESAFSWTDFTNIDIPNSVTSIGVSAFYHCEKLTSIVIPEGITKIENSTFDCCFKLTSVTLPSTVTSIGEYAFSGTSLTSILIPDNVTIIDENAFFTCNNLESVKIGNSVTTIKYRAFGYCPSLINITIPNSVTEIHTEVFAGCSNLTSIVFENTNGWQRSLAYTSSGTSMNVSNPSTAAYYLTSGYKKYYWIRSDA